jgi:glycosyltransferase involved in cell wall biosynthesis
MPRVQLLLAYYDRPSLVRNALVSIRDCGFDDWQLYFVDDGSPRPGLPVVESILKVSMPKIKCDYIPDSEEEKQRRGGSRFGSFLNKAIVNSDAEVVVMICDDDALIPGALSKLVDFYENNANVLYAYSWIAPYDPSNEAPHVSFLERPCHLNREGLIHPSNQVDSSQVTWRRQCFDNAGVRYPEIRTRNLDSELFATLHAAHGLCHPTRFHLQYKAIFENALGARPPGRTYVTGDPDPAHV